MTDVSAQLSPPRGQPTFREATPGDVEAVLSFIAELAAYERLAHAVVATADDIEAALFCDRPKVFCDLAEVESEPVGFALWFYTFSTFVGRHGI